MRKEFIQIIFILFFVFTYAQNKKTIDSINSIPFEVRLKNASILNAVFVKNLNDSKKLKYSLGEGESYSNLALINYYQGNFENDLYYSLKAINIFEKINRIDKLSLEFGELGFRMKKRNLKKGLYYMQKAIYLAEQNSFQKPLLSLYNNYGVLKEMLNQKDSALIYYNKGLVLKEKIKDSVGLPYSLNNIAGLLVSEKKFKLAKRNYDRALLIRLLLKDEIGIAENYTYLGDLYYSKKEYQVAIYNYKIALEKSKKYNYIDLIQNSYKMLSQNYEAINDKENALINYKLYSFFKDSLFSEKTNSKIAELDIKFETAKKEKLLIQKEAEAKKRNQLVLGLALFSVLIGLIGFLIYRQQKLKNTQQSQAFELKQAINQIETQNKLQSQRLAISKDLHDNIGAQLTFIISSVETAKFAPEIENTKLGNKLTKISDFTKDTIVELRDTIWAMNSNEISFEDLQIRISNFIEKANDAVENSNFKFNIDANLNDVKLSSIAGMNIYRTIQEAVNNALKYAKANEILVDISKIDAKINIRITDNGIGFDENKTALGNGLNNMKKRIEEIGGTFNIDSEHGTKISILI